MFIAGPAVESDHRQARFVTPFDRVQDQSLENGVFITAAVGYNGNLVWIVFIAGQLVADAGIKVDALHFTQLTQVRGGYFFIQVSAGQAAAAVRTVVILITG